MLKVIFHIIRRNSTKSTRLSTFFNSPCVLFEIFCVTLYTKKTKFPMMNMHNEKYLPYINFVQILVMYNTKKLSNILKLFPWM